MAAPPVVVLSAVSLRFGASLLFDAIDLAIAPDDRLCLVGRNGSGKSTLLKLIAGSIEPDSGQRSQRPGLSIGYLPQEFDRGTDLSALDHVLLGLAAHERAGARHRAEAVLAPLGVAPERAITTLSGGEGRRVALARALVSGPDLLLLDEPTNHLDLPAIEWLEGYMAGTRGAVVLVSHDRALLERVSSRTAWLDRRKLRVSDSGFASLERWQEQVMAEDAAQLRRMERKLEAEEHWLQRGVTARRRRNQGRLRALHDLRGERAEMLGAPGRAKLALAAAPASGDLVIVADHVSKRYGELTILRDFSTRIRRCDRIAIIGPNGVGKTTMLRLLTGQLEPDSGTVTLGSNLRPAYFDQQRATLKPERSLWQTLCPAGGDSVEVRGRKQHVVGYLRDFLFDEAQALSPVASLSGGERSRLLLAMLMATPSNLLVLDEPTNDLDMDTLDLLEDVLGDYDGTLLIVSHDRDFVDRLATGTIAFEGAGRVREYVGGYGDYLRQRPPPPAPARRKPEMRAGTQAPAAPAAAAAPRQRRTLGYGEQRELDRLPATIDRLGAEVAALEARLADRGFYQRDPTGFADIAGALEQARARLAEAESRWLKLAEKQEKLGNAGGDQG